MREFTTILKEELETGLPPTVKASRRAGFLHSARALRSGPLGLEPGPVLQNPFPVAPTVAWPFPQMFLGEYQHVLAAQSNVRVFDGDFDTDVLSTINPATGSAQGITGNDVWHFADLGHAWFLFNGTTTVFRTGLNKMSAEAPEYFAQNTIPINAGCQHRGRIVTGGFNPSAFWNTAWNDLLTVLEGEAPAGFDVNGEGLAANFILWSSIGGGDFPLWLFFPQGFSYDLTPARADLIKRLKRNEWGFMPMPFSGIVRGLHPMGSKIVVLGADGVAEVMLGNGTYGRGRKFREGIPQRGCFAGDDEECFFISNDGKLWRMRDAGIQELGYEAYLLPLLDETVHMVFDDHTRDLFISNGELGYLLTDASGKQPRLTEARQFPTSAYAYQGGLIGVAPAVVLSATTVVVTGILDFGLRALKTINALNLFCRGGGQVSVALDFRYNQDETWTRTPFVEVNKEHNAVLRRAGTEFRIVVRATDWSTFEMEQIDVKWHALDRRQIRGPYANSQSNPTAEE